MSLTIRKIAALINAKISGDPDIEIQGVSSFDDAGHTDLTFAGDSAYLSKLDQTRAGAVLVPDSFASEKQGSTTLLLCSNPKLSFFKVVEYLYAKPPMAEFIHSSAVIEDNLIIGKGSRIDANVFIGRDVHIGVHVHIMPNAYVGDGSFIGDHTIIKPNVSLMDLTRLGKHVIVHSGTVIGSDGYGFAQDGQIHAKLIHTGHVEIGDHVEIGACNTIDRGTLGVTRIGNGVKTDNQVHIAHNVKIGDNSLVVAQVGIAGSTTIGKGVILAGKAGVSGHLTIGDGAIVGPYAGVSADLSPNEIVSGAPHMPHKTWLRVANIIPRLPELRKKLLSFEKRLKVMEGITKDTE